MINTYFIAGHAFSVVGGDLPLFVEEICGFDRFKVSNCPREWCVEEVEAIALPDSLMPYVFDFSDGSVVCALSSDADHCYFSMREKDGDAAFLLLRHELGSATVELSIAEHLDDRASYLRFALWMAFCFVAVPHGVVPIHASTIVYQGRSVLFLGESGTGKSTHTKLWKRYIPDAWLLNDDSPLLSVGAEGVLAHGSPWSGKTHCYHNAAFPVAGAVRLSQAPHNRITRLATLQAFASLQPSCPPALFRIADYADAMVEILSQALGQIPVFHLECLPDADAARLSCHTLFPSD